MMRQILFIVILFLAIQVNAQTTKVSTTKLDKESIVKDSDGNPYPYAIWTKLMQTGQYSVKRSEGGEFLLYRLTAEQEARMAESRKAGISKMAKPRASTSFIEGEKFKVDRFTSINKLKFDMKSEPAKIYVFNFWFINCPPCKQEIPDLNALVKQFKDSTDVVFLAIALDESFELKNFLKTTPFDYHIIPDGRYFSQKHGVTNYPTHVIVGKDGLIKFSGVGLASNTVYWIEKTIKEQLSVKGGAG